MNYKQNGNQLPINEEENEELLSLPPSFYKNENEKINEKIICDFIIKEKLGEGTFGKVRLGINRQTEETVAIKILDKKKIIKEKDKIRIDKELKILKSLRHPNIVHLYSDIQTGSYIYIIMEYIKGIELLHYISSNKKLSEEEACFYFRQIISAIEYLHKLKIAHRDIKPENMIIENETKIIKLVDFGLSSYYNTKSEMLSSACGSPSYAAPEMLYGKKYSASPVDIWSCGIVLYAMICGYLPFEDLDFDILYKKIKEGKFKIPLHVSPNAKDLIKNLLITNPKKRYTIEQIKKHKWFKLCLNNEDYRNKKSLYEGLLLNKYIIPLDENIISIINNKYQIDKKEIIECLLKNEHNDITTIYDLMLLNNSKAGKESIADLTGNLFQKYLEKNNNLLINYNNDINKVIEEKMHLKDNNNINQEEKLNEKNDEININLESNFNMEKNKIIENNKSIEQDNNNKEYVHMNEKEISYERKKETSESKQQTPDSQKATVMNKNKYQAEEKLKQKGKLKINNIKENRNHSATKRPYNLKIIKKKYEIKEKIQIKKPKSKENIKTVSNGKNIKLLNTNPTKEKKINKIKEVKPISAKRLISSKEKNKNKIYKNDEIIESKNINRDKKHKTYRPNPFQHKNIGNNSKKKLKYKEGEKNITINIIKAPNFGDKRIAKSVENRKKFNNQKSLYSATKNINNKKQKQSINIKITKKY